MNPRIFYECADFNEPSGGLRRLYRHVEILRKHGLESWVLHHTPGFRPDWFATDAPVEYWTENFVFDPSDILVIPEGHVDVMRDSMSAPCERVVIALNWANIYLKQQIGADWRDYGITRVIAGSQYERHFISCSMGLDSTVLVSGTDTSLFRENGPKTLQVAYMPRKNHVVFHTLACIFRSRFPEWAHVPFVPIDSVSHREVARLMAESAVFLATSFPEGLARPPIEAMSSGCIVVGFAGFGSLEYMRHGENCYRAEDLDVLTAAEYLAQALTGITTDGAVRMKAAARETAECYSLQREERAVLSYWQKRLAERHAVV